MTPEHGPEDQYRSRVSVDGSVQIPTPIIISPSASEPFACELGGTADKNSSASCPPFTRCIRAQQMPNPERIQPLVQNRARRCWRHFRQLRQFVCGTRYSN
jgi:hypothetical protein